MSAPRLFAIVVGLLFASFAVHCGSFGEDATPGDEAGGDDAGSDGESAAPTCVPQPIDTIAPDAGGTATCEPDKPPISLASSSQNCGRCGHDCLGDPCMDGLCAVADFTTGEVAPPNVSRGRSGATILYTVNGPTVLLRTVDLSGGQPSTLATLPSTGGYAMPPVAAGSDVFVVVSDVGIIQLEAAGGTTTTFVSHGANQLGNVVVDARNVYSPDYTGKISAFPRDKSASFVVQASTAGVGNLASDGTTIFWTVAATTTTLKSRGPGPTDDTFERVTGLPAVKSLALDADYIYLVLENNDVSRVAKKGTAGPERIAHLTDAPCSPKGFTVDEASVFVACSSAPQGGTGDLQLYSAPKCGGPTRLLARDLIYGGGGLVSAGGRLYWGRGRSIARISK